MSSIITFLTGPWATPELISWNFQILVMGFLVCISCALVGTFVSLRRMSLLGDAISHGILPGIVLAYLFTGSLSLFPMWIGAALAGIACGVSIQWLHTKTRLREDAAMGLTFTTFFALGMVLLGLNAENIHLDVACILYGEIGLIPLETDWYLFGKNLGNQAIWSMGFICIFTQLATFFFYKILLVTSFDLSLAKSLGIPVNWVQYGLMFFLALVVVASFESVGVIMVLAMMILPPVSLSFLFTRLPCILWSCIALSIFYSLGGIHLAYAMDFPISASIALTAVFIFLPCCLLGSKGGLLIGLFDLVKKPHVEDCSTK